MGEAVVRYSKTVRVPSRIVKLLGFVATWSEVGPVEAISPDRAVGPAIMAKTIIENALDSIRMVLPFST